LRDTSDIKKLPLGKEGDKFNISVIGGPNGEIILKDGVPVWSNNNQPVYKPGEIDKNRGRNCALWYQSIYTESKYDANCCFTFLINKQQQLICETSPFCIQRAKKLMNFTLSTCHANSSIGDKINNNPGYIPEKPFYKNPDTKNYGWDEYLGEQKECENCHKDNIHKSTEIPVNGIIPPQYDSNLTEQQREAFRSVMPADKTLVDRHKEGYWRGLV